jgi:malonyl-CoA decarboxylase
VSENHEKFAATGCISAGQDIHKLGEHLSPLLREKNNV